MKKNKLNKNIPQCVMCHKNLAKCDIEKIVCVCVNPACPNFSLLSIPEDTIYEYTNGFNRKSAPQRATQGGKDATKVKK